MSTSASAIICCFIATVSIAEARSADPVNTAATAGGAAFVDPRGMTLYTFDEDKSARSACGFVCSFVWPPLSVPAGAPLTARWSAIDRGLGMSQLVYKGRPLYTYVKDSRPGDATGEGVDGVWHIARP
jgi:predicted lipoprotein with Yx(FWY)xxD motif